MTTRVPPSANGQTERAAVSISPDTPVEDDVKATLSLERVIVECHATDTPVEDDVRPRLSLRRVSGVSHTPTSKLVRGMTGQFAALDKQLKTQLKSSSETLAAIGSLVAEVLKDGGWGSVDRKGIQVEDKSGYGGGRTYKVWCAGAIPPAVALHSRSEVLKQDGPEGISEKRAEDASVALSQAGVAPRRIAQGSDFVIEAWDGTPVGDIFSVSDSTTPEEIGQLLAKIHAIPTGWYEKTRDALKQSYPWLQQAPHSSIIWWYGARPNEPSMKRLFSSPEVAAAYSNYYKKLNLTSPHALKLVTLHGDFHTGNMIRNEDGLKAIDLEFTCAGPAVQDLCYAMQFWCKGSETKRAFIRAYLNASGLDSSSDDIDTLIFDAEIYQIIWSWPYTDLPFALQTGSLEFPFSSFSLTVVERARTDGRLRKKIIEEGLAKYTYPGVINAQRMVIRNELVRHRGNPFVEQIIAFVFYLLLPLWIVLAWIFSPLVFCLPSLSLHGFVPLAFLFNLHGAITQLGCRARGAAFLTIWLLGFEYLLLWPFFVLAIVLLILFRKPRKVTNGKV